MKDHLGKTGRNLGVPTEVVEYDILRNRRHDLTKATLKRTILTQIEKGMFDFIMASPPCGTFSRARKRDSGPPPLRSEGFPRGLPW